MSIFKRNQKPGFTAAKPTNSRIVQGTVSRDSEPTIARNPFLERSISQILPKSVSPRPKSVNATPSPKPIDQKLRKRPRSTSQRLDFDSDDNDASDEYLDIAAQKRARNEDIEVDLKREIRSREAFSDGNDGQFSMVHAADIASLSQTVEYKAAFPQDADNVKIQLQYPSASQRENYELVVPINNEDFKPLEDIREVMEIIIKNYLPESEADKMTNDSVGLIRRIKRAMEKRAGREYIDYINEWNDILVALREDGTTSRAIDGWKSVDLQLLERILTQTYSRTVSPRVHMLRHYQNGTDNVYGELLPKFVSLILKKDVKMKSNEIFVDLGSGVGNCVLQAALEVGCESWGCEMMDNACDLADLQEEEFSARCRLWGLSVGDIHLERGNFLANHTIHKVLQKADVVLVNNQAFTPKLNEDLTNLFLDLKEGAKVVSLKSFVPHANKIQDNNVYAAYNKLDVVKKTYYSGCVSWTDAPGTYFISTKDSSKVQEFLKKASR